MDVCTRLPNLVVLAGLVSWTRLAWAGPGVIVEDRVEAFAAPSREASVAASLGRGAQVCVLDAANYTGVVMHRPSWLAIRLPGGVAYVPIEAVDLSAPAPDVRDCGASMAAAGAPAQSAAPGSASSSPIARMSTVPPRPAPATQPVPVARPALLRGGFVPPHPARFMLGLGTGMAWLDKDAAAMSEFDDSSLTLNGMAGLMIWDIVSISGAFSLAFPSDHASFTQVVVDKPGSGDPYSASSSLSLLSYSIAVGLRTPFWALGATRSGWVATALFAEYGGAGVTATRTISNCEDCRVDKLNVNGGTFWRVGVDLLVPRKPTSAYGLTISYQRYAAGTGFHDEVRFGFSCWLL